MESQSLETTCPTEPTCGTLDPAVQVSWQRDKEHDSNTEPDFEMGTIKKTLVIEPTHPGTYYCATADDVAQLIENPQGDISFMCFLLATVCLTLLVCPLLAVTMQN